MIDTNERVKIPKKYKNNNNNKVTTITSLMLTIARIVDLLVRSMVLGRPEDKGEIKYKNKKEVFIMKNKKKI